MQTVVSENLFLDWYPRGRLALILVRQSVFLKENIIFLESLTALIVNLTSRQSNLRQVFIEFKNSFFSEEISDSSLFSESHSSSEDEVCIPNSSLQNPEKYLALERKLSELSDPVFLAVVNHPIFLGSIDQMPELARLSDSPELNIRSLFLQTDDSDEAAVKNYYQSKIIILTHFLQVRSAITTIFVERFHYTFESSVFLLKRREPLLPNSLNSLVS